MKYNIEKSYRRLGLVFAVSLCIGPLSACSSTTPAEQVSQTPPMLVAPKKDVPPQNFTLEALIVDGIIEANHIVEEEYLKYRFKVDIATPVDGAYIFHLKSQHFPGTVWYVRLPIRNGIVKAIATKL